MPNKILLVDGMALLFRHFYATSLHKQFMYNSQGVPTNGIQGFVRHIFSAIHEIRPTHVAVCWIWDNQLLEMICLMVISKIVLHHQKN